MWPTLHLDYIGCIDWLKIRNGMYKSGPNYIFSSISVPNALTRDRMPHWRNSARDLALTQYFTIRFRSLRLFLLRSYIRYDQALLNGLCDLHTVACACVDVGALALVQDARCYGLTHGHLAVATGVDDRFDDALLRFLG